jgi:hypothetical protein
MSTYARTRPRVRDPAVALWSVAAACWAATILLAETGGAVLAMASLQLGPFASLLPGGTC